MSSLLARFAENCFWMGRYMERVENLSRMLDVNETVARDSKGHHEWLPIVQIQGDEEAFFKHHKAATADAVIAYYVTDRENGNSIASAVWAARENARALRHLISIELWRQLNELHGTVSGLRKRDLALNNLSDLCTRLKLEAAMHFGIAQTTLYHDETWLFYQLGRHIERADQTTRLLDIKYHRLLPKVSDVGSPVDMSEWNALLRSAGAYHGFRRIHPRGMTIEAVAEFLLFDERFPRSLTFNVGQMTAVLDGLEAVHDAATLRPARVALDALQSSAKKWTIDRVVKKGMHEFLDTTQLELISVSNAVGRAFFGWEA